MIKYTKRGYSWIISDNNKEFVDIRCLYSDIQNVKYKQTISNIDLEMVLYENKYPILIDAQNKTIYVSKDIDEKIAQKLLLELLKSYFPHGLLEYKDNHFSINTSKGSINGYIEFGKIVIETIDIKDMVTAGNIFKIIINSKFKIKTNLNGRMIA